MSPFIEGLAAGYGIAIPVGAIAILIISMSMQCGFKVGFMAGAGAATADILYAALASAMGSALIVLLEPISLPLRIMSGLLIIGLAVYGFWHGVKSANQSSPTARVCKPLQMYIQFIGLTVINPLTVVYFTAFMLGRSPATAAASVTTSVLFVLGVGVASLSWQTLLAVLGGVARSRLPDRLQLATIIAGNALVLVLGLKMLITAVVGTL